MISDKLTKEIEKILEEKITNISMPPQGMGSQVFFVTTENDREYAIKQSGDENNDSTVLNILSKANIDIAVPNLVGSFNFEGQAIVILERINFPLLESIEKTEMHKYISSMVSNLKKLHEIKSDVAGYLNSDKKYKYWKDFLLSNFNNDNPNLDWQEIAKREGLDTKLVLDSVNKIMEVINDKSFIAGDYSLLHSDFNQRNLFVNPNTDGLAAIIDWGEAMYGDPIYDFARIRMYIWHFNLGDKIIEEYYNLMQYSDEEKKLDTLYWLSRIIEYLAYYSEELNEFNLSRIKLHQEFLRNFNWDSLI